MTGIALFGCAIVLMMLGHGAKTYRWRQFISVYEQADYAMLLNALSVGHLVNAFVPFRLGDIVRVLLSGRKLKNGYSLAISTVVADLYVDTITVGGIFWILSLTFRQTESAALFSKTSHFTVLALVLIVLSVIMYAQSNRVKLVVQNVASLFNPKIELRLLHLSWAIIHSIKDIYLRLDRIKFVLSTMVMWAAYILSYALFAHFTTLSLPDVFLTVFSSNVGTLLLQSEIRSLTWASLPVLYTIYMVMPLVLIALITAVKRWIGKSEVEQRPHKTILPQLNENERLSFLEHYFSGDKQDYIKSYIKINQDINIIRDYSSGSNDTTILCVSNQATFFRKYSFGENAPKLYEQVLWLKEHAGVLPVAEVLRFGRDADYCYYDMPYISNGIAFFDYIHTMPVEQSWNIIHSMLGCLTNTLYRHDHCEPSEESVQKYIDEKVLENIDRILEHRKIKALCRYDTVVINNVEYHNLPYYLPLLRREVLQQVFAEDIYTDIHGDLTIENIICVRNKTGEDGFYLIDPNTSNYHDSPNLDYAKLLQSLHGGYEFFMTAKPPLVKENRIDFLHIKSAHYYDLYGRFDRYLASQFTPAQVRSIYFHELVHWLRLMPYKLARDEKRAPMFYAGMLIVMQDVMDRFGPMLGGKNEE
ncbi:flippase-like domain-containing protein [Ruminococcaceae bacterium OttesenSCG-928-I18]|nr:flippase-like domain-containing protein [Ruminococcaceae bacterium OttesenSCG-928-I18]